MDLLNNTKAKVYINVLLSLEECKLDILISIMYSLAIDEPFIYPMVITDKEKTYCQVWSEYMVTSRKSI